MWNMTRIAFQGALLVGLVISATLVGALEAPTGRIILQVSGEITESNSDGSMEFDLDMLDALGVTTVTTETPWTEGPVSFQGVLIRDLLATVGSTGTSVDAEALNDYTVTIPVSDFSQYDVILATRANGEVLTVRDRGPVWIIYPWTDQPMLQNEIYYSRSIWQLKSLIVKSN